MAGSRISIVPMTLLPSGGSSSRFRFSAACCHVSSRYSNKTNSIVRLWEGHSRSMVPTVVFRFRFYGPYTTAGMYPEDKGTFTCAVAGHACSCRPSQKRFTIPEAVGSAPLSFFCFCFCFVILLPGATTSTIAGRATESRTVLDGRGALGMANPPFWVSCYLDPLDADEVSWGPAVGSAS